MRTLAMTMAALALLAVSCGRGRSQDSNEILTNENTEADLGLMNEIDGPVSRRLVVINERADTLYPLEAQTLCGCLTATVDRNPVPPGEKVKIDITYNPAYRKGIVMEELQVRFGGIDYVMSLIVKGEVNPYEHPVEEDYPYDFGDGIHLSHETLHFGKLEAGESRMIYIRCANENEAAVTLDFTGREDNLKFRHNLELPASGRDTLHFRFTMPEGIAPDDTLLFAMTPSANGAPLDKMLEIKAIGKE